MKQGGEGTLTLMGAKLMALPEDARVGLVRREAPDNLRVTHGDGLARGLVRGSRAMLPVEFRSGPREFEEYYLHSGEEFMYVLEGQLEVTTYAEEKKVTEILRPGDSCYIDASVPHLSHVGPLANGFSGSCGT